MPHQLLYFKQDLGRLVGKRKVRWLYIWLGRVFWGLFLYRFERSLFLLLGTPYRYLRIIFLPIFNLIQGFSNIDIHYKSDIKGGVLILHPSVGIVVSGYAIIGSHLTLTGGNVIGVKGSCQRGDFKIGHHCSLGANAVILGPLILANHITIGALACVVKDCVTEGVILAGVPAKVTNLTVSYDTNVIEKTIT